jgi:hypothetical protein
VEECAQSRKQWNRARFQCLQLSKGNLETKIAVCGFIIHDALSVVGHVGLMCFVWRELTFVNVITWPELLSYTVTAVKVL